MGAAAKSSAALTQARELVDAAHAALTIEGFYNAQVVRAERVADGRIEVLFHVERAGGGRAARLALIRTDNGVPAVVVHRGWPLLKPRP